MGNGDKKLIQLPVIDNSEDLKERDLMYVIHDPEGETESCSMSLADIKEFIAAGNDPDRIDWEQTRITKIQTGNNGILLLTENGKVYGGRSADGAPYAGMTIASTKSCPTPGIGDYLSAINLPTKEFAVDIKVIDDMGMIFTGRRDENDELVKTVYVCGRNSKTTIDTYTPLKNKVHETLVADVLCGPRNGQSSGNNITNIFTLSYVKSAGSTEFDATDYVGFGDNSTNGLGSSAVTSAYHYQTFTEIIHNVLSLGKSATIAWSDKNVYMTGKIKDGVILNEFKVIGEDADAPNWERMGGESEVIKMCSIGKSGNGYNGKSYYIITEATDGVRVYGMGNNDNGQIGTDNNRESDFVQIGDIFSDCKYVDFKMETTQVPALLLCTKEVPPDPNDPNDPGTPSRNHLWKIGLNSNCIISSDGTKKISTWTESTISDGDIEIKKLLSSGTYCMSVDRGKTLLSYVLGSDGHIYVKGKNKAGSKALSGSASISTVIEEYTRVLIDKTNAEGFIYDPGYNEEPYFIPGIEEVISIDTQGTGSKGDTLLAYSHATGIAYGWGNNSSKKILFSSSKDGDDIETPTQLRTFSNVQLGII